MQDVYLARLIVAPLELHVFLITTILQVLLVRGVWIDQVKRNVTRYFSFLFLLVIILEGFIFLESSLFLLHEKHQLADSCSTFYYLGCYATVLKILSIISLPYYNLIACRREMLRFEKNPGRIFIFLSGGLLLLSVPVPLPVFFNLKVEGEDCFFESVSDMVMYWHSFFFLMYLLPLLALLPPGIILYRRITRGEIQEPRLTQVKISLAVPASFLLLHLPSLVDLIINSVDPHSIFYLWLACFHTLADVISVFWLPMIPMAYLWYDKPLRYNFPRRKNSESLTQSPEVNSSCVYYSQMNADFNEDV